METLPVNPCCHHLINLLRENHSGMETRENKIETPASEIVA